MKRKNLFIGLALVLCVGVAVFLLSRSHTLSSGSDDGDDAASSDQNVPSVITVQTGTLQRVTLHQSVDVYGEVEAAPATMDQPAAGGNLSAPVAGTVAAVKVVPGQTVKKGDVLIELNSDTASLDYAKAEVQRQQSLFAQQNTSQKNLEDARAQLAALEVVAPISGTVTSVNAKPGQAVDPSMALAQIIDLSRLALGIKVPATQAAAMQAGQEVDVLGATPLTTSLSFVSAVVDPQDGTVSAWAMLPSDSSMRPGELVPLKIVTAVHTNCLAAPAESVVTDDSGNSFIPMVNDNEATQTPVQIGFRESNWVEVAASGLKEGDPVVTVGAYGLADKTQVKIDNGSDQTNAPRQQ
jgi:membrane fusion protein (multidrug efflux system)